MCIPCFPLTITNIPSMNAHCKKHVMDFSRHPHISGLQCLAYHYMLQNSLIESLINPLCLPMKCQFAGEVNRLLISPPGFHSRCALPHPNGTSLKGMALGPGYKSWVQTLNGIRRNRSPWFQSIQQNSINFGKIVHHWQ